MSKLQDSAVSVGLVAKQVINQITRSSHVLVSEISFDCLFCKDTGFEERDGRYQRCRCRSKSSGDKVGGFLKRRSSE